MKIAWVSPYNDRSAIARMSAAVVGELAGLGHDVTVVRSETEDSRYRALTAPGKILLWSDVVDWNAFDITVINFGDSFPFHAGGIAVADKTRAVGIFHDWFLLHLFIAWKKTVGLSALETQALITRFHGAKGWDEFVATPEENWVRMERPAVSMLGWLAEKLDGAIAHSNFYRENLQRFCPGSVTHQPLPMPVRLLPAPRTKTGDEPLEILTFGFIHPNKRVETVLHALASLKKEVEPFIYRAAGAITSADRSRLGDLAQSLQINFKMEGRVSEAELNSLLAQADIICCLRHPALEGASGSVIEALNAGKATIVTNTGCYADIPDDCVLKVRPEAEQQDLRTHLGRLMKDAVLRKQMGTTAAVWSLQQSNVQSYARALVRYCDTVISAKPVLRTAEVLGGEIGRIGLPPHSAFLLHIGKQMEGLWPNSTGESRPP